MTTPLYQAVPDPVPDETWYSDLPDTRNVPLDRLAEAFRAGDALLEPTLRRIAPSDGGRVLLVAASFNSAI